MKNNVDQFTTPADEHTTREVREALAAHREWLATEDELERVMLRALWAPVGDSIPTDDAFKAALLNGALDELIERVEYTDAELEL